MYTHEYIFRGFKTALTGGFMYAKVVVVELWYGFCEEIYCIIEHPF